MPTQEATNLSEAWRAAEASLARGDGNGALRKLAPVVAALAGENQADDATWSQVYRVLGAVLTAKYDAELGARAAACQSDPFAPALAYALGHALIDRDRPDLAAGVLSRARARHPDHVVQVTTELVSALQLQGRHAEVTDVLAAAADLVERDFHMAYLEAFNAVMNHDVERATRGLARLERPTGATEEFLRRRIVGMLARHRQVVGIRGATEVADDDHCAWYYIHTAGLLFSAVVSDPHPDNQTPEKPGRMWDDDARVRQGLTTVCQVLEVWKRPISAVLMPTDRASRIMGHALAELCDVPAIPWFGTAEDGLVAIYDLGQVLPELRDPLIQHHPDQPFFAHTASAVTEGRVAPDLITYLHGANTSPWGPGISRDNEFIEPIPGSPEEIAKRVLEVELTPDQQAGIRATVAFARELAEDGEHGPAALRDEGQRERLWVTR